MTSHFHLHEESREKTVLRAGPVQTPQALILNSAGKNLDLGGEYDSDEDQRFSRVSRQLPLFWVLNWNVSLLVRGLARNAIMCMNPSCLCNLRWLCTRFSFKCSIGELWCDVSVPFCHSNIISVQSGLPSPLKFDWISEKFFPSWPGLWGLYAMPQATLRRNTRSHSIHTHTHMHP